MLKQVMQPNERADFQLLGEFFYIQSCTGVVLVQTVRGEYRLSKGAQIFDKQLSGRITVENLGGEGLIEIISGFGQYIPPTDGQKVNVEAMPPTVLAPNQAVNVEAMPPTVLAPNQAVNVEAMPPTVLAENQNVAISTLPKVQLATGQVVRVTATTPLLTKPTGGSELTATQLTVTANVASLAANTRRCHAVIKAKATNAAEVLLAGGFSLAAGEKQKIEATCELTFSGTDGDIIEIYEVVR